MIFLEKKAVPLLLLVFLFTIHFSGFSAPVKTYDQLVSALKERRDRFSNESRATDAQENVEEAWDMGRMIEDYVIDQRGESNYKASLTQKLSADLPMEYAQLTGLMKFAREYPAAPKTSLTWSYYSRLITVDDPVKREEFEKGAIAGKWNSTELADEIAKFNLAERARKNAPFLENKIPELKPGPTHIYRVVKIPAGPFKNKPGLDLGFSVYKIPEGAFPFQEGNLVAFENGNWKMITLQDYVPAYEAEVTQIIDGDTMHVLIDLGFGQITEQRVRLQWIDAPELRTPGSDEARQFLADQIEKAGGRVLLSPGKVDKFNRTLVDIWANGLYLNRELQARGLAVMMRDT